jgi:VCBS repeat-containing protein
VSNTPTTEPTVHTAGDTLRFTRALPDYLPADGWTLTYALVNAGTQITLTGSDNGDGTHLVEEVAADTAAWSAGHYRWQAFVSKGTDRFTVGRGMLEVRANFATADTGLDARGTWQTILDNLEAAYAQMSAGEIKTASVTVGGNRVVQYRSLADLVAAINNARQQAAMEQGATATSGALGINIKARF